MPTNQSFEYLLTDRLHGTVANGTFEFGFADIILSHSNRFTITPSIISPVSGRRVEQAPVYIFEVEPDPDGDALHFKIDVSTNNGFSNVFQTYYSRSSQNGWQYSKDNGVTWLNVGATGVKETSKVMVRFTMSQSLPIGTYFWRVMAHDGHNFTSYRTVELKVGNKIVIRLKNPIETSAPVKSLMTVIFKNLARDGQVPSSIKMFACNNAFDTSPTWEDASVSIQQTGLAHAFLNNAKTASKWGLNIRVEVFANDSLGQISVEGFGFTFN